MLLPGESLPSTVEPPVSQLKHLARACSLDFVGDEAEVVPLNVGPSILNFGGSISRSGGLPHLIQHVGHNEGTMVDSVCLSIEELRAKK